MARELELIRRIREEERRERERLSEYIRKVDRALACLAYRLGREIHHYYGPKRELWVGGIYVYWDGYGGVTQYYVGERHAADVYTDGVTGSIEGMRLLAEAAAKLPLDEIIETCREIWELEANACKSCQDLVERAVERRLQRLRKLAGLGNEG